MQGRNDDVYLNGMMVFVVVATVVVVVVVATVVAVVVEKLKVRRG